MFYLKKTSAFRLIACFLVATFSASSLSITSAAAGMIATDQVVSQTQAEQARERVDTFMAREDVKQEFLSLGVDPAEAQARAESLSDSEVVTLAGQIDELPAGQGVGGIVGAAVFIFIVLLITDLLGFTNVFDFTNKGSANPS